MQEKFNTAKEKFLKYLNRFFAVVDQIILIFVAFGLIIIAIKQLYDSIFEDIVLSTIRHIHPVPYQISELLIVLIVMELFKQVYNQINRKPFSLNPFIYIGFIVTVRGMIVTEMKLSSAEMNWIEGITILVAHAVIILILVFGYFIYSKASTKYGKNIPTEDFKESA